MNILVLNCGSSSAKYKLIEIKENKTLAEGGVEKIGLPDGFIKLKFDDGSKKNIDLGLPEELADAPEEIDLEPSASSADSADKEDLILQLLVDLDTDGKGAPRDVLEDEASAKGISPMELEEITNSLMEKGLIYEPNLRYLKRI